MRYRLFKTRRFEAWESRLRDPKARVAVAKRLTRLQAGHFGDAKHLGDGVLELRIFTGPGYRVYFCLRGDDIVLLLLGGDKGTQRKDVELAKRLAKEV